jgi:hypothetical protein
MEKLMADQKQKKNVKAQSPILSAFPEWNPSSTSDSIDQLAIPSHPGLTEAIGRLAIAHTHLELTLRYTVKTLAGLSVKDALDATQGERISDLRKRIRRLFVEKKPAASELVKLDALLGAAQRLSENRNGIFHSAWSQTDAGNAVLKREDHHWAAAPSASEVNAITVQILALVGTINDARLHGFLHEATKNRSVA